MHSKMIEADYSTVLVLPGNFKQKLLAIISDAPCKINSLKL